MGFGALQFLRYQSLPATLSGSFGCGSGLMSRSLELMSASGGVAGGCVCLHAVASVNHYNANVGHRAMLSCLSVRGVIRPLSRFGDDHDGSALPWLLGIARNVLADTVPRDQIETRASSRLRVLQCRRSGHEQTATAFGDG